MRRRSSGSRWIWKRPYRRFEISDSSALVLAWLFSMWMHRSLPKPWYRHD
jgi:hypothetical protein